MKVSAPKDNLEIVTSIMLLSEEMVHLKEDIKSCQKAIVDHAEEARISNKIMNDTVMNLQFSVTGLKDNFIIMQKAITHLTELSTSLITIGSFIVRTSKILAWLAAFFVAIITIKKYLQ